MPEIKLLYQAHNSLLEIVCSPRYLPLSNFLTQWQQEQEAVLGKSSDTAELYRAQGRLEVLRRLIGLKQELREYGDKHVAQLAKGQGLG